jgi:hypothetical protein
MLCEPCNDGINLIQTDPIPHPEPSAPNRDNFLTEPRRTNTGVPHGPAATKGDEDGPYHRALARSLSRSPLPVPK